MKKRRVFLYSIAFSFVGAALVLLSTATYGLGASPDSIAYISTARNLLASKGFVLFDGSPYVAWPPLFPSLLALIDWGGIDPFASARYVNAICLGLLAFATSCWLLHHIRSIPLALLGSVAILLSPPLVAVSLWAWTEPLFILFTLLCLFAIEQFLRKDERKFYFLSITLAALAVLSRYSGGATILTGVIAMQFRRDAPRIRRLIDSAAFALLSSLPLFVWLARNYLAASNLMGERGTSTTTLGQNISLTLDSISAWFLPAGLGDVGRIFVLALIGITAIGLVHRQSDADAKGVGLLPLLPSLIFILVYVSYLVISELTTALDLIDTRLLSPISVPLVFAVIAAADNLRLSLARHIQERSANLLVFAGVGILFAYSMGYAGAFTRTPTRDGLGYSGAGWKASSLVRLLGNLPGENLYTNEPEAVYFYTGLPAKRSPRTFKYNSSDRTDDLATLTQFVKRNGGTYLVWFSDSHWSNLVSLNELETLFKSETKVTASDGAIYFLK